MNALEELKKREVIRPTDWMINRPLDILITNTSPMASNFLYQAMFLLEGRTFMDRRARILILDDKKRVSDTDIRLGLYVAQDKGKNRADVLINRYSKVFHIPMIKVMNKERIYENVKEQRYQDEIGSSPQNPVGVYTDVSSNINNMIVIGFGKSFEKSNEVFNRILEIKQGNDVRGSVARIHGVSDKNELTIVNTVYRKYGDVVGETNPDNKEASKRSVQDILQGNQMIAQTMINYMNLLITNDEATSGLPLLTWRFNTKTLEQKNTYCTSIITIFHKTGGFSALQKLGVPVEKIEQADKRLKESLKTNQKEYMDKLNQRGNDAYKTFIMQYKNLMKDTINDKVKAKKNNVFKSEIDKYHQELLIKELLSIDRWKHQVYETGYEEQTLEVYYSTLKYAESIGVKML